MTKMLQTIVCNELNVVFDKHKEEAAAVGSAMFAMTSDMEDNADDPDGEYQERRIAGEKRLIARCEEKGVEYHDLDTVETLNIKVAEKRKRSLQGIVWEYVEKHGWQKTGVMGAAIHSANPQYSLVSIKSKISTCRNAEKTDKTPAKTIAKKLWKPDMSKSEFTTLMKQYGCAGRTIRELWQNLTTTTSSNNKVIHSKKNIEGKTTMTNYTKKISKEAVHPNMLEAAAFWQTECESGKYKDLFDGKPVPGFREQNAANFFYIRAKGVIGKEGRISTRGSVKDIFADISEHIDAAIVEFTPEDITDLNGKHREKHPGCEGHELRTKAHPSFLKERDGYRQALPVAADADTATDDGGGVSGTFQTDGPPAKHNDTELSLRVNILSKDVAELKKGGINKSSNGAINTAEHWQKESWKVEHLSDAELAKLAKLEKDEDYKYSNAIKIAQAEKKDYILPADRVYATYCANEEFTDESFDNVSNFLECVATNDYDPDAVKNDASSALVSVKTLFERTKTLHDRSVERNREFSEYKIKTDSAISTILKKVADLEKSNLEVQKENAEMKEQFVELKKQMATLENNVEESVSETKLSDLQKQYHEMVDEFRSLHISYSSLATKKSTEWRDMIEKVDAAEFAKIKAVEALKERIFEEKAKSLETLQNVYGTSGQAYEGALAMWKLKYEKIIDEKGDLVEDSDCDYYEGESYDYEKEDGIPGEDNDDDR